MSTTPLQAEVKERRRYVKPEVTEFGSIENLALGGEFPGGDDNGDW